MKGRSIEPDPALLEEVIHLLEMEGAGKVVTPATKEEYFGAVDSKEVKERRVSGDIGSAGAQMMSRVGLDDDGEESKA